MKIVYVRAVYGLDAAFEERWLPKAARWTWHERSCAGQRCLGCEHRVPPKYWYTRDDAQVVDLILLHRIWLGGRRLLEMPGDDDAVARLDAGVALRLGGLDLLRPPRATDSQRAYAKEAMKQLSSRSPEGGGGFNRVDYAIGSYLGETMAAYTDGAVAYAAILAAKYSKQLPEAILLPIGVSAPDAPPEQGRLPYKD